MSDWLEYSRRANEIERHRVAERYARFALTGQPGDSEARFELARSLWHQSRFDEAAPIFRGLVAELPYDPYPYLYLGDLAAAGDDAGRLVAAEDWYRRALAAEPTSLAAASDLARCLSLQHRFDEAATLLESMLAEHPSDTALLRQLARIDLRRRKRRKAARLARMVARIDPDHVDTHELLLLVALYLGRPSLAGYHLREVRRLDPDWHVFPSFGETLRRGQWGDAVVALCWPAFNRFLLWRGRGDVRHFPRR